MLRQRYSALPAARRFRGSAWQIERPLRSVERPRAGRITLLRGHCGSPNPAKRNLVSGGASAMPSAGAGLIESSIDPTLLSSSPALFSGNGAAKQTADHGHQDEQHEFILLAITGLFSDKPAYRGDRQNPDYRHKIASLFSSSDPERSIEKVINRQPASAARPLGRRLVFREQCPQRDSNQTRSGRRSPSQGGAAVLLAIGQLPRGFHD